MANGKHANGISSFTISNRALYLHVLENLPCKVFDDLVFCNLKTMMTLAQERAVLPGTSQATGRSAREPWAEQYVQARLLEWPAYLFEEQPMGDVVSSEEGRHQVGDRAGLPTVGPEEERAEASLPVGKGGPGSRRQLLHPQLRVKVSTLDTVLSNPVPLRPKRQHTYRWKWDWRG